MARPLRVAVIGGGIGGLAAAHALLMHGMDVTVFEKARQPVPAHRARARAHQSPELALVALQARRGSRLAQLARTNKAGLQENAWLYGYDAGRVASDELAVAAH